MRDFESNVELMFRIKSASVVESSAEVCHITILISTTRRRKRSDETDRFIEEQDSRIFQK